jgi:hypothetical protein
MLKGTTLQNFTCYVHILCWLPLTEGFITRQEKQLSHLFSQQTEIWYWRHTHDAVDYL